MPALPSVPGLVKVEISGNSSGKPWANIFHVQGVLGAGELGYSDADLAAIAQAFGDWWNTSVKAHISSTTAITQWSATDLTSVEGFQHVTTGNVAGTIAGAATSPEVCYLINWRINRRYRGGHPRTYLAGVPEANVDAAGVVDGTSLTALGTAANALITDVSALTLASATAQALAIPHYFSGGALQPSPAVDAVVSGSCNQLIGVQRRRLRR